VLQDVRLTLRMLRRSPTYAGIVVAVLALGIGANLLAFGFYKALALSPIAGVAESDDLLIIGAGSKDGRVEDLPFRDYEAVRDRTTRFSGVAGTTLAIYSVGQGADARRIYGELVSGSYFPFLGVKAQFGRTLQPSDDAPIGAHPVIAIADSLWRRRFGADPGIVGTRVIVDGLPMTIVGVLPPSFHGTIVGLDCEIFAPFSMQPRLSRGFNAIDTPGARALFALVRLRSDVSLDAARAELAVLDAALARDRSADVPPIRLTLIPIADWPLGMQTYARPLVSLMGGTAVLLLLTVCANVAALVLARCVERHGEIAARLAVGANRTTIVRLVLLETLLLAVPGALGGLGLSRLAAGLLLAGQDGVFNVRFYFNSGGSSVFVFAVALAAFSAVLCGLAPALRSSRVDLASALRDGGRLHPPGRGPFRGALVVAQITASLILVAGMAVAARSFLAARTANPGFDASRVTAVTIDTQPAGYSRAASALFYDQLVHTLQNMPGVESAGLMRVPFLMLWDFGRREFVIEGQPETTRDRLEMSFNIIGGDHFQTLRIPLLAGRDFARTDDASAPRVAIVNETLARRYWGSPDLALGHRLQTPEWTTGARTWMTIVGVVRDIKYIRLTEPPTPYVYLPFQQASSPTMGVLMRGDGDRSALLARVTDAARAIDPSVPIIEARMLDDITRLGFAIYDVAARVLAVVGAAAAALAALGVYGSVAYTIRQRLREIGIRMAIGATPSSIRNRFIATGLRLATAGVAVGLIVVMAAGRLLESVLYGVSATDALSLATAAAAIASIVAIAAAIPAWRASRIDPIEVLRHS